MNSDASGDRADVRQGSPVMAKVTVALSSSHGVQSELAMVVCWGLVGKITNEFHLDHPAAVRSRLDEEVACSPQQTGVTEFPFRMNRNDSLIAEPVLDLADERPEARLYPMILETFSESHMEALAEVPVRTAHRLAAEKCGEFEVVGPVGFGVLKGVTQSIGGCAADDGGNGVRHTE